MREVASTDLTNRTRFSNSHFVSALDRPRPLARLNEVSNAPLALRATSSLERKMNGGHDN